MTPDPAEEIRTCARQVVTSSLSSFEQQWGPIFAGVYAEGMLEAAIIQLKRSRGNQGAFDLLHKSADSISDVLMQGLAK